MGHQLPNKAVAEPPTQLPPKKFWISFLFHFVFTPFSTGQFWNVPADITPYEGQLLGGKPASSWYTVSITTAGHSRKYSGYIYSLDWEGDSVPCLYVGNNEGGPVSEAAGEESGVIDGSYRDYVVGGPFSEENYVFGIFKEEKCVK